MSLPNNCATKPFTIGVFVFDAEGGVYTDAVFETVEHDSLSPEEFQERFLKPSGIEAITRWREKRAKTLSST